MEQRDSGLRRCCCYAAAQAFCTTIVASFRTYQKSALPFAGEVVVVVELLLQLHATHGLQQPQNSNQNYTTYSSLRDEFILKEFF